ncbi:polysaccharide deacetylase family protein [Virgibacillus sp. LDC-1]|uniref:polysaccharide deacetylase family protein n=1 Tax=Virgibacillus sp. LDC-1 TaxID=3039856 RepID=UPI0024DE60B6|nr:polysaccharide deacetylase family protein [Virgibacillus sp. LDC-1]
MIDKKEPELQADQKTMTFFHFLMLELLSIEITAEKAYLRVCIIIDQRKEYMWEIDLTTAEYLKRLINSDDHYKYRISLQSSKLESKNQHVGILTQTFRDESKRTLFPCSEAFVQQLQYLKDIKTEEALQDAAFLSLPSRGDIKSEMEEVLSIPPRKARKHSLKAVVMLITMVMVVFGFSTRAFLSKELTVEAPKVKDSNSIVNEAVVDKAPLASTSEEETEPQQKEEVNTAHQQKETILSATIKIKQDVIFNVPDGYVAITFDDGPSNYTKQIVDTLTSYQVGGTFFFTGLNVSKHPSAVRYVHDNGYSIGNHSMNHKDFTTLNKHKQSAELLDANKLIEKITNEKVVLFRPPYGAKNEETVNLVKANNGKVVLWNNDPEDWRTRQADKILQAIQQTDVSGSIILLHETKPVLQALPAIIEYLTEQNLKIISLR